LISVNTATQTDCSTLFSGSSDELTECQQPKDPEPGTSGPLAPQRMNEG